MLELLQYSHEELTALLQKRYGGSPYYGDALFRHIYRQGNMDLAEDVKFAPNPSFSKTLTEAYAPVLPEISELLFEGDTSKFTLNYDSPLNCESVLIRMKSYDTLCVSSQLGCRWKCAFCETGKLGLKRNLQTREIMAQILTARFKLGADKLRNLVFMGMGEPFENLEEVLKAVDIVSDPRGMNLPAKYISLSTAGYIPGIRRLSRLCSEERNKNYHKMHLSISLHSADQETRNRLMPINRAYPLEELGKSLRESPYSRLKDGLYIEYLVLPGITDREVQIDKLLFFLEGMEAKINLIPYNPGKDPQFRRPEKEEMDRLWERLKRSGYLCRTRFSRGETLMAACGQLGGKEENLNTIAERELT